MPHRSLGDPLADGAVPKHAMGEPDWAALRDRAYNLRWATVARGLIPLTAADPDLPIAQEIGAEIARYVATPHLSYGPAAGLPAFTSAVARHFGLTKGASVDPTRVTAANSAASALMLVARHVVMPGDEVVVQDPVDFLVGESVRRAGGSVRRWLPDADGPNAGRFTVAGLKAAVTDATRTIAL
ncbi:MAG: aminotransferase class I/II-fold pyridoxal phosphate-dependent enzyme, partial [Phycisphaerales bacterium]